MKDYFYVLGYRIVKSFKFRNVDDDDALQEAVIICFKRIDHFDPVRGKAFNFFTTLIVNQLKGLYRRNKSHSEFLWQMRKERALEELNASGASLGRQLVDCISNYEAFAAEFDIHEDLRAWDEERWKREDDEVLSGESEKEQQASKKKAVKATMTEKKRSPEEITEEEYKFPTGMSRVQFSEIWESVKRFSDTHRLVLESLEREDDGVLTGRGRINKACLTNTLGLNQKDVIQVIEDTKRALGDSIV